MQWLSNETVLSNKVTRNRTFLSFKDSSSKPLRRRPSKGPFSERREEGITDRSSSRLFDWPHSAKLVIFFKDLPPIKVEHFRCILSFYIIMILIKNKGPELSIRTVFCTGCCTGCCNLIPMRGEEKDVCEILLHWGHKSQTYCFERSDIFANLFRTEVNFSKRRSQIFSTRTKER